jgi:hypothetical protein
MEAQNTHLERRDVMAHVAKAADLPQVSSTVTRAIGSTVRQTWWLALGVLAIVGEQTARAAEGLVQKGQEFEPNILEPIKRATSGIPTAAEGAGARLKVVASNLGGVARNATETWGRSRGPTQEQFDALAAEVKELRAKLAKKAKKVEEGLEGE